MPFLRPENFHFQLEEFAEKYGPVVGLKFGSANSVAICGAKEVEEVFKRDEFQGRPIFPNSTKGISSYFLLKDFLNLEGQFFQGLCLPKALSGRSKGAFH